MRTLTGNDRRFGFAGSLSLAVVPAVSVALGILFGQTPASVDGAEGAPAAAPGDPPAAAPGDPPAAPGPAAAQPAPARREYTPMDIDLDRKRDRLTVNKILRAGAMTADQQTMLDEYYTLYAFPLWTQTDQLDELPKRRAELRYELSRKSGAPHAHDRVVQLALEFLGNMAKDPKRDPAARYNAMLAIADLNSVESPRPTDLPVPLPAAFDVLKATFNDASQIDAVRVAALLGIYRHTVIGMAKAGVPDNEISPMMLALAQSAPPAGRSVEGHAWMRALAMMTLAQIREVGAQNAVVLALAAVVADQADLFLTRSTAARALGNLDYQASSDLDPTDLSVRLAQLAFQAGMAELTKMEEEDKEKERARQAGRPAHGAMGMGSGMGSMYGGMEGEGGDYGGGPGGMMGGEAEDEMMDGMMGGMMGSGMMGSGYPGRARQEEDEDATLANRRRLMARLGAVFFGFTKVNWINWARRRPEEPLPGGIASLATAAPHQQAVGKLQDRVRSLLTLCGAKDLEELEKLLTREGQELSKEEKESSFREVFRGRLESELNLLREAISEISPPPATAPPAADPATAAEPAAATPPADAATPPANPATPPANPATPPADSATPAGNP